MDDPFQVAGWAVDPLANEVRRDGVVHTLEPKVMQVLLYLARRPGETVRREHLIRDVWRTTYLGDEAVSRCISVLRRVFEDDSKNPRIIATISKVGYRLVAPIERTEISSVSHDARAGDAPPNSNAPSPAPRVHTTGNLFGSTARVALDRALTDDEWSRVVSSVESEFAMIGELIATSDAYKWVGRNPNGIHAVVVEECGALESAGRVLVIVRRTPGRLVEVVPAAFGFGVAALVAIAAGIPWLFGVATSLAVGSILLLATNRESRRTSARLRRELAAALRRVQMQVLTAAFADVGPDDV